MFLFEFLTSVSQGGYPFVTAAISETRYIYSRNRRLGVIKALGIIMRLVVFVGNTFDASNCD